MSGAAGVVASVTNGATVTYPGTQGNPPSASYRTVTGAASTGITVRDNLAFLGPLGAVSAVPATGAGLVAARALGWGGVGAVAASWVAQCAGVPVCVGSALAVTAGAIMLNDYRVRNKVATDHPNDLGSDLGWDSGVAPSNVINPDYFIGGVPWGLSETHGITRASACNAFAGKFSAGSDATKHWGGGSGTVTGAYYCTVVRTVTADFVNGNPCTTNCTSSQTVAGPEIQYLGTVQATQCPGYVDPLDPSQSIPAGQAQPGPDGKCPTGRYSQTNNDAVAAMLAAHTPATDADVAKAVQAFNDWLHSGLPCPGCSAAPVTLTGPATATAPTVTSTTTDASGTTTTATTDQYQFVYGGSVGNLGTNPAPIQWTKGTTTVTTGCPASSTGCTTTTTSTGTTGTTGNFDATSLEAVAKAKLDNAVTQCDKFPDTVGCAAVGTAPSDQVPKKANTLTFSEESVSLPSACPQPSVINGKAFSWQPVCDAATSARPWVLIGAAFTALSMCLVALQRM